MHTRCLVPLALVACGLWAAGTDSQSTTRRPRIRLGGVMVGVGYSHWSGYGWGYPGYGFYGPWTPFFPAYFAWDPFFYHPYYANGFAWGPNMGEVKLHTNQKDAEVFLDGGYAGAASERKSMWLDPGAYNLEVRAPGAEPYTKRIYVLSGRSLRINAGLRAH